MNRFFCRVFQRTLKLGTYFMPWRSPELLEGAGALRNLPALIKSKDISRVLIVTDKGLKSLGMLDPLTDGLEKAAIDYFVYDKTVPNPTVDNIENALILYKENNCQGIIAFGGGSPMDCAKATAARAANPKQSIAKMKGLLKIKKKLPMLFAVPTTAGTGSEVTLAAVVSNPEKKEKYAINDFKLIPPYAVLDPLLTLKLPPFVTATTGMDALTHAVEAYIGKGNTKKTKKDSEQAAKLIIENLLTAYHDGGNTAARENMLKAAYFAGMAFTRAYVGYVHAVAHTLSGYYNVPHGLANAVILPYVLELYGKSAHKKLSALAAAAGIGDDTDTPSVRAGKFIETIKNFNKEMSIPEKIEGIKEEDIPAMIKRALSEGNPLYPVPRIWQQKEMRIIFDKIK